MTCYLRMHEVMVGVESLEREPVWEDVITEWQRATTVEDRNGALSGMAVEPMDIYDLPRTDLGRFNGLILSGRVDQEFLHQKRAIIRDFLDDGKVVVFSGQLFRPWLPGAGMFTSREADTIDETTSPSISPHQIFEDIRAEDLGGNFVYAHGHHPPPEGAEALVSLPTGEPVMYVDETSTEGTVLMHTGHNLLGYAGTGESARRLMPQLLSWINSEGAHS